MEGRRAGGPCFQMKLSAGCTEDKTEGRAAQKGGAAGCQKGRGGLQERAASPDRSFPQPSLMCSPLAPLNVQPTGQSWCNLPARSSVQLASPRIIHVFHLATRLSSPPALRLVLSQKQSKNTILSKNIWQTTHCNEERQFHYYN